jgi:perosamine synthetase
MIPVYSPYLGEEEKKMLLECIDSGWLSGEGPHVKKFEQEVSDYIGVKYSVSTSSGTSALEVALHAIGIGHGDEVIIPALTNIACAISVLRAHGTPVLVDVELDRFGIDPSKIEEKVTSKTKAIMVVHLFGHPVDMERIYPLAKKYNLKIIEDCAQAFGASYRGQMVGKLSDISAFSFYGNKIITTGEGGMVCTSNDAFAEKAKSFRNLYFGKEEKFLHPEIGYNFRMSNLQAAVGLGQLNKVKFIIERKRKIARLYQKELLLKEQKDYSQSVFWMNYVLIPKDVSISAREFINELSDNGIESRPFFSGLHVQPALLNMGLFKDEKYQNTEYASKKGFYLPSGPDLKKEEIKFVCETIKNIFFKFKKSWKSPKLTIW